jgi:hypothetical protein
MDAESESADRRVSHYRLLHSLGAGGMGEVFAAFDETLKRRVALKAIHASQLISSDAKARFLREAQILSRLDHPHICRVHDYLSEGGRDFLVLELIEGKSLRAAIQAGLDRAAVMKIAQQGCLVAWRPPFCVRCPSSQSPCPFRVSGFGFSWSGTSARIATQARAFFVR